MKRNIYTQTYDYSRIQMKLNKNRPTYVEHTKYPKRLETPFSVPLIIKIEQDDYTYIVHINEIFKGDRYYSYGGIFERFVQPKPVEEDVYNFNIKKVPGGQVIQYSSMWTFCYEPYYPDIIEKIINEGEVSHNMLKGWSNSIIDETEYVKIVLSMDKKQ